eukprot:scaffold31177_cov80-Cyclotella_meneghiniana.AAC.3
MVEKTIHPNPNPNPKSKLHELLPLKRVNPAGHLEGGQHYLPDKKRRHKNEGGLPPEMPAAGRERDRLWAKMW